MRMFIKFCSILLISLSVAACGFSTKGDFFREAIKQKGKKIAGQTLENSVWYICRGSPVGAVKDRFGISDEKTEAYNNICITDPINGKSSVIDSPRLLKEEVPNDLIL